MHGARVGESWVDLVFLSYKILLQQHDNGQIFVATIMTKKTILAIHIDIGKPYWQARLASQI